MRVFAPMAALATALLGLRGAPGEARLAGSGSYATVLVHWHASWAGASTWSHVWRTAPIVAIW